MSGLARLNSGIPRAFNISCSDMSSCLYEIFKSISRCWNIRSEGRERRGGTEIPIGAEAGSDLGYRGDLRNEAIARTTSLGVRVLLSLTLPIEPRNALFS